MAYPIRNQSTFYKMTSTLMISMETVSSLLRPKAHPRDPPRPSAANDDCMSRRIIFTFITDINP